MEQEYKRKEGDAVSSELAAFNAVVTALSPLPPDVRQRVIESALTLLGGSQSRGSLGQHHLQERPESEIASSQPKIERETTAPPGWPQIDIRRLKEEKQPGTAIEMATLVAYYLAEMAPEDERKDTITSDDITKYFKQASFRLPGAAHQSLKNAKNSGYLDALARGEYKLNPVGYNLVVHSLPNKERKQTLPAKRKPTRNDNSKKQGGAKKQAQKKK